MPEAHTYPQAQIIPERSIPGKLATVTNVGVPFSEYQKYHNVPYTARYFDVGDLEKVGPYVAAVEMYVKDYMNENGYEDSTSSFDEIISGLMLKMGVSRNETSVSKLAKLSKYIELVGRGKQSNQYKKLLERQSKLKSRLEELQSLI